MELKEYQKESIEKIKKYLEGLGELKEKKEKLFEIDESLASGIDLTRGAWQKVFGENSGYKEKKNGLGEPVPNFCIKVPTGGGKTLLATHTIDLINSHYGKRKTGFVLWVVPTTQIYRQTLLALKDRNHPYRKVLDHSSGGKTQVIEKTDRFSPQDVEENLVIMVLMLPSANRKTKETLRIFKDAGGYETFFPAEDNREAQRLLIEKYPNLDFFDEEYNGQLSFNQEQVKTSLGNTLRLLKPIVILDESQKSYSEGAKKTIQDFNPSLLVELSATPPKGSNILIDVMGRDLDREEMIKLDLHITNKSSADWKNTMAASVEKRAHLEKNALDYEANTHNYIRPICLVQVERTGKDQRDKGYIHSLDVYNYLVKEQGIPKEHIAIKSSEKDDIEGIDLKDPGCPIRFIITKQALQEGWDEPFAYVLTILTNPTSKNGLTQLVGRILRQPYARKTKIPSLDESYVYCFQQRADNLLKDIKKGLEGEGLGDLEGRIMGGNDNEENQKDERKGNVKVREKFKHFKGKIYLPRFLYEEPDFGWREVSYDMDILSRLNWSEVNLNHFNDLSLAIEDRDDTSFNIGLSDNVKELIESYGKTKKHSTLEIDLVMISRHLTNLVPNPFIAYGYAQRAIKLLKDRGHEEDEIAANQSFIIEELKKVIEKERDRLAEKVFRRLLSEGKVKFLLEEKKGVIPNSVQKVRLKSKKLRNSEDELVEKSLVEPTLDEDYNGLERSVALALDSKEKLLWWYRNIARADYAIQGWKKHKIYPDFIAAKENENSSSAFDTIYVLETKGDQLLGNIDTNYKRNIFELCNELGRKSSWNELGLEFEDQKFDFQLISESEWKNKINEIFES
ncbi:restriction endonuclease subunit R [Halobacillus trueperi]|uniref:Restriction endonuclease subunit R n=1 Tax=Halobacillus trueperi TaxID=156205 RepID=A0A3D8VE06_9BACI|nr:DEAD/DEAH box helicase family protein [Halobacillus trueperi]RDY67652.1 restriction endonuclease subunit R [Halobacillus trueperi]